jgi:hypothetical protein
MDNDNGDEHVDDENDDEGIRMSSTPAKTATAPPPPPSSSYSSQKSSPFPGVSIDCITTFRRYEKESQRCFLLLASIGFPSWIHLGPL